MASAVSQDALAPCNTASHAERCVLALVAAAAPPRDVVDVYAAAISSDDAVRWQLVDAQLVRSYGAAEQRHIKAEAWAQCRAPTMHSLVYPAPPPKPQSQQSQRSQRSPSPPLPRPRPGSFAYSREQARAQYAGRAGQRQARTLGTASSTEAHFAFNRNEL
jgi:hypothetical protein